MSKLLTILLVFCLFTSVASAKPMFEFNFDKINELKEGINNVVNKFTNRNNQAQEATNTANIELISLQNQYNTNNQEQLQIRLDNLNTPQNINAVSNELRNRNININCVKVYTDDSEYYLEMDKGLVNFCNPEFQVSMTNNDFEQITNTIETSLRNNKITYLEALHIGVCLRNTDFVEVI